MNAQTRALAVQMLREGKPLGAIGDATGLLDREVIALAKEVSQHVGTDAPPVTRPSTTPTSRRCDHAGCAKPATHVAGNWGFCEEHTVQETPTKRTIAQLLEHASGHSVTKVRKLAGRVETHLDQLRDLVTEHEQAELATKKAAAERAAAAARVKELEEQLRAAKAALRGKPPATPTATKPAEKTCADCGSAVVRRPGQTGPTPKRCDTWKAAAA